jgi:AcrR family transcriptional regulator
MNTKEKIIKIATKLLSEKDYDSISLSLIAEKAGIKKPSLYYYFESKEALYDQVINNLLDCVNNKFDEIVDSDINAKDKLEKFIYLFLSLGHKKKNHFNDLAIHRIKKDKKFCKSLKIRNKILDKLEKVLSQYEKENNLKIDKKIMSLALLGVAGSLLVDVIINKGEATEKDFKNITKKSILILLK